MRQARTAAATDMESFMMAEIPRLQLKIERSERRARESSKEYEEAFHKE